MISEAVQQILRSTKHPELPAGEIQFRLLVQGAKQWSWANFYNNGAVTEPVPNEHNEKQDAGAEITVRAASPGYAIDPAQWARFIQEGSDEIRSQSGKTELAGKLASIAATMRSCL